MNGASKILTVSYGTFSCTLEGFDDPFNTMKAIAEYFRDLAADDRYFGAEPPTPDAAMLHKIAEREINRRVEAKIAGNGVVLRAEDAPVPRIIMRAAQPAPAPTMSQVATPAVAPSVAPSVASVADPAPAVESAAARLSRLRAAQSQILAPQPVAPFAAGPVLADISSRFADVEAYAEDQEAESTFKPAPITLNVKPVRPAAGKPVPAGEAPVMDAPMGAPVAENLPIEVIEAVVQAEPAAEGTRAVAEPGAEVVAEVHEEEIATSDDAMIAALSPSVSVPAVVEAEAIKAEDGEADAPVLDAVRETLAGLMAQDDQLAEDMAQASDLAPALDGAPATFPEENDLPEDEEDVANLADMAQFHAPAERVEPSDLADLAALDGAAPIIDDAAYVNEAGDMTDGAGALPVAELPAAVAEQPAAETPAAEVKTPEIVASSDAPVVAEKLQRARARVIKIRRLDKKAEAPAPLSPEAEADLQSTLAALEAEIAPVAPQARVAAPGAGAQPVPAQAEAPAIEPSAEKTGEAKLSAADDAAVDRLLAQTNSQLEVPETKRRRSAIAHLKAAVLATVADRRNNPKAEANVAEVKMDPYRKDLDKAVRPVTGPMQGERPAPLVLVSAQRIDRKRDAVADAARPVPQIVASSPAPQTGAAPAPGPSIPVRPRRVTSGGLAQAISAEMTDEDGELTPDDMGNIFADGSKQSFAEFAESLGATTLAELIEAAGAYCTLVLDRPNFTRPLLFQQISTMPQMAEANREDGLRGFGKLLRDGRIQKTVRGQFALSETSPILTEAKRIAG